MRDHLDKLKALADERDRLDQERDDIQNEIAEAVEDGQAEGLTMQAMADALRVSRVALYKARDARKV